MKMTKKHLKLIQTYGIFFKAFQTNQKFKVIILKVTSEVIIKQRIAEFEFSKATIIGIKDVCSHTKFFGTTPMES